MGRLGRPFSRRPKWKDFNARIELVFDPDHDHPLESVLMGHPERRIPFLVPRYQVLDAGGRELARGDDNRQGRRTIVLPQPVVTREQRIVLAAACPEVPAALFAVRCYATAGLD
ncbi:MAG: hypothetical protein ACO3JJ_12775 [Opitutaceae bacterium]